MLFLFRAKMPLKCSNHAFASLKCLKKSWHNEQKPTQLADSQSEVLSSKTRRFFFLSHPRYFDIFNPKREIKRLGLHRLENVGVDNHFFYKTKKMQCETNC